jgi:hypothetical protein
MPSMFSLFFMFLVTLHWCLHIWWNTQLIQTLLITFSGKRPFLMGRYEDKYAILVRCGNSGSVSSQQHSHHAALSVFINMTKIVHVFTEQGYGCPSSGKGYSCLQWQRLLWSSLSFFLPLGKPWIRTTLLVLYLAISTLAIPVTLVSAIHCQWSSHRASAWYQAYVEGQWL